MAPLARRRAAAILISLLIAIAGIAPPPALALPGLPWGDRSTTAARSKAGKPIPAAGPSGRLQEVAAPGGVEQLRNRLANHQPRLHVKAPSDGSVIQGSEWTLELDVEDWPLASDPDLGIGPHVALQIDDQPPLRFSEASPKPGAGSSIQITLPALAPGSHRLSAYAAYPWGEAVKSPGASLQWRLHQLQALKGTQPERDEPWLVMVSPADLGSGDPLLLDWLVWNAPLQNLREGDGRWRLRLTVNGDSFLVDRQEAVWIRQSGSSTTQGSVQMELLDGLGDPITPSFNNQLRAIPARSKQRPIWLQSRLTENELARLLGEPEPNPEPQTDDESLPATPVAAQKTSPTSAASEDAGAGPDENKVPKTNTASTKAAEPLKNEETATAKGSDADPQAKTTDENNPARPETQQQDAANAAPQDTTSSKPRPPAPLTPDSKDERLAPTTSLGGSARELLNADGTQR